LSVDGIPQPQGVVRLSTWKLQLNTLSVLLCVMLCGRNLEMFRAMRHRDITFVLQFSMIHVQIVSEYAKWVATQSQWRHGVKAEWRIVSAILNLLRIRCCVYVGGGCCWRCISVANSFTAAYYAHHLEHFSIHYVSNESRVVSGLLYVDYCDVLLTNASFRFPVSILVRKTNNKECNISSKILRVL